MKKKILIKEGDLDKLIEEALNEYKTVSPTQFYKNIDGDNDSEQLEFDFPNEEKDTVIEMLEEKYDEIIGEVREALINGGSLDSIYDNKLFPLWKELHKLGDVDIVHKFNHLEDSIVNIVELSNEYHKMKEELDSSITELKEIIGE